MLANLRNITYLTFFTIGVANLWPWNNVLSASLFFQNEVFGETSIYAKIFTSSVMTVSTVMSLVYFLYIATQQYSYATRIRRGLIYQSVTFVLITLVCMLSTGLPYSVSFALIILLNGLSAVATVLTQSGGLAIANVLKPAYSQSIMVGQALAGVLPSAVLFIVSLTAGGSTSTSGYGETSTASETSSAIMKNLPTYLYLLTTPLVCLVCLGLYHASGIGGKLLDTPLYVQDGESTGQSVRLVGQPKTAEELDLSSDSTLTSVSEKVPLGVLYEKLKYLIISIFVTSCVTLVFPVFTTNTLASGLPFTEAQYAPLIFTVWNLGDLYGRVIADWPAFGDKYFTPQRLFVYSILRIGAVPLYFMFAIASHSIPPTGIRHTRGIFLDAGYILLQFLFGVTNGHIIALGFMEIPGHLDTDAERKAAGAFGGIFVAAGLAAGSILSYLFVATLDYLLK